MRPRAGAVAATFVVNGLGGPGFLPRLPERQAALGLSDAGLGLVLVGMAAGALVASPVAGRLIGTRGSRPVVVASAVALGAVPVDRRRRADPAAAGPGPGRDRRVRTRPWTRP